MTRSPVRDGLAVGTALWIGAVGLGVVNLGTDAFAYWMTRAGDWYNLPVGAVGAFTYSPAFGLSIAPIAALPWHVFSVLWAGILVGSLLWMRPRLSVALLCAVPVVYELGVGNIHILLAAAVVAGFRWPAAWAFVLLTKVTPGVGLLWFVVRREWRNLAIALAATSAIILVCLAIDARAWVEWIGFLAGTRTPTSGTAIPIPLWIRLPAAALLVVWGARTDRRWTVVVAAMMSLPVMWFAGFAGLVAIGSSRLAR